MPNLLAHYGTQGVLTRLAFPAADLRWILLGAFVPDLPWVIQRAAQTLLPGADLHTVRLYVIVQASLLFGLLLCAALALLARRPGLVFGVLSVNVLLHLVLDSLEEKWGIGVHLLAPLHWDEWNASIFPMDGPLIYVFTAIGLAFCLWEWRRRRGGGDGGAHGGDGGAHGGDGGVNGASGGRQLRQGLVPGWLGAARLGAAALLLVGYLMLPLLFIDGALASDAQFVRTLLEQEERPGRFIALDREDYLARTEGHAIVTSVGDTLRVERRYLDRSATVSVQGRFVDEETLGLHRLLVHRPYIRDAASYLGLLILAVFWLSAALVRLAGGGTRRGLSGSG